MEDMCLEGYAATQEGGSGTPVAETPSPASAEKGCASSAEARNVLSVSGTRQVRKRKRVDECFAARMDALNKIAEAVREPAQEDFCAAFGKVVAEYLRAMNDGQRLKCQMAVLDVISQYV